MTIPANVIEAMRRGAKVTLVGKTFVITDDYGPLNVFGEQRDPLDENAD